MKHLIKNRFDSAKGQEVPLDYFLYSCFEAELLHKHAQKKPAASDPNSVTRMESVTDTALGAAEMDQLVEKTYTDHCLSEPLLTTCEAVDFEKVGPITVEFIAFTMKLTALYKKTTGNPLPVYSHGDDAPDVWKSVIRIVDQKSPSAAGLFKQYFAWTYNEWETPVYEIGSRPPVGRYAPPPKPRPSTSGPKNSERTGKSLDRRVSQPGKERGSRHNQTNNRNNRVRVDTRDDSAVQNAQSVVRKAVATLTGDPRLEFVDLPAANSFQRRQQHHFANELGFQTKSIGEGTSRAVRISRGANQ